MQVKWGMLYCLGVGRMLKERKNTHVSHGHLKNEKKIKLKWSKIDFESFK